MEQRCAVLLRGINVGKGNRLAMADLRAVLEGLGCEDVSTYLNSGNAVVTADPDGLAERVEAALRLPVRVVVFTADELAEAVAGCPWPDRAKASPKLVHVGYLDRQPSTEEVARLGSIAVGAGLGCGAAGRGDDDAQLDHGDEARRADPLVRRSRHRSQPRMRSNGGSWATGSARDPVGPHRWSRGGAQDVSGVTAAAAMRPPHRTYS
jgi:hypothetical protein